MDLEKYLQNSKTSYLAELYKRLLDEITATEHMIKHDPSLAELAVSTFEIDEITFNVRESELDFFAAKELLVVTKNKLTIINNDKVAKKNFFIT